MRLRKPISEVVKTARAPSPGKLRELCSDALVVIGAAAVAVGIGLIYLPAGIIAGGLLAIGIGWQLSQGGGDG